MADYPALPLWTDAYLADTSHLNDAEHGRYLLMLMHLWRMPAQRFPSDDAWLARKFGRSEQDFVLLWKPLMQEFMQNTGNWWMQKRLTAEWEYVSQLSQKRRAAAKSRWEKGKSPSNWNAPTPTPTPTPIRKKKESGTRWPVGAVIPQDWLTAADAARNRHGLPAIDLALEAERFGNYWADKTGAGSTKLSWRMTWINWALNAKQAGNGKGKGPSAHDKFFAAGLSLIQGGAGDAGAGAEEQGGDTDGPGGSLLPP